MSDELKYFKVSGNDIKAGVIVVCKPEEEDALREKFDGYEIEPCERPENASFVMSDLRIGDALPYMRSLTDSYLGDGAPRRTVYDGPCCGRCANRFRRSDWCSAHYRQVSCHRFKLEK